MEDGRAAFWEDDLLPAQRSEGEKGERDAGKFSCGSGAETENTGLADVWPADPRSSPEWKSR